MTAPKGMSLHVSVNAVDPGPYLGFRGNLVGCTNDARAMADIARMNNFAAPIILDGPSADATTVLDHISNAATQLDAGDTFFFTFAGHATLVRSLDPPADEREDTALALYDRLLIDDELGAKWREFRAGVRILFLADSCHSGTPAELALLPLRMAALRPTTRIRLLPGEIARAVYEANRANYEKLQRDALAIRNSRAIAACVLVISACQDRETADDGTNGLFTAKLLDTYANGIFAGTYYDLWRDVRLEVTRANPLQHPSYVVSGTANQTFLTSAAFTL